MLQLWKMPDHNPLQCLMISAYVALLHTLIDGHLNTFEDLITIASSLLKGDFTPYNIDLSDLDLNKGQI